ncbi:MAG TPA: hypothetical protein VLQ89_05700 [Candidatus Binatia bacterium]|nr:hypothetical protein [Candidatus Binatia bacterium]
MITNARRHAFMAAFLACAAIIAPASSRQDIRALGEQLARQADDLAQRSYDIFKGRKGEISDREQAVLFRTEAFAASCRLFLRLCEENTGFGSGGDLRTTLYNAYAFLTRSFGELEQNFRSGPMTDCRDTLSDMERAFAAWPDRDNLAYLHQKFVQADDQTVYVIERRRPGEYLRRPFSDLESLYRFNYLLHRTKDPWKYRVQVERPTLEKMELGEPVALTFNGCLVMDMVAAPNRPVFLIENGKRRPLSSPAALNRFGGWKAVFEVPADVIAPYPMGDPVQ